MKHPTDYHDCRDCEYCEKIVDLDRVLELVDGGPIRHICYNTRKIHKSVLSNKFRCSYFKPKLFKSGKKTIE